MEKFGDENKSLHDDERVKELLSYNQEKSTTYMILIPERHGETCGTLGVSIIGHTCQTPQTKPDCRTQPRPQRADGGHADPHSGLQKYLNCQGIHLNPERMGILAPKYLYFKLKMKGVKYMVIADLTLNDEHMM